MTWKDLAWNVYVRNLDVRRVHHDDCCVITSQGCVLDPCARHPFEADSVGPGAAITDVNIANHEVGRCVLYDDPCRIVREDQPILDYVGIGRSSRSSHDSVGGCEVRVAEDSDGRVDLVFRVVRGAFVVQGPGGTPGGAARGL